MATAMNDDATGKRFSQVYLTGGEALPDGTRARVRIAALLSNLGLDGSGPFAAKLAQEILCELGVKVRRAGAYYSISSFVEGCELRDFLDLITLVHSIRRLPENPTILVAPVPPHLFGGALALCDQQSGRCSILGRRGI